MRRQGLIAGGVLTAGAATYTALVGAAGVTFNITPLLVGVAAVAAGLASTSPRLVIAGLPLVGWGAAVLAIHGGAVQANRTAPAYLVGSAVGLLAADTFARRRADGRITGGVLSALSGGLSFYLAYDFGALGRWTTWAVMLVVWAAWEAFGSALRQGRRSSR